MTAEGGLSRSLNSKTWGGRLGWTVLMVGRGYTGWEWASVGGFSCGEGAATREAGPAGRRALRGGGHPFRHSGESRKVDSHFKCNT